MSGCLSASVVNGMSDGGDGLGRIAPVAGEGGGVDYSNSDSVITEV